MLFMPVIADAFGRRIFMFLFILVGSVTIIIEMVAKNWKVWTVAKATCGLAMGMIAPGPLTMISEIVFPQMRGSLLCAFAVAWSIGGIFSSVGLQVLVTVSPKLSPFMCSRFLTRSSIGRTPEISTDDLFRMDLCFHLPCDRSTVSRVSRYVRIGHTSIISTHPDRLIPAWLISKGKIETAKKSYRYIIGNVEDFDFEHEFAVLVQDVTVSKQLVKEQPGGQWRALFEWRNFRRMLIPVLPSAGANIVGGAYVYNYTTYFFQQAGLSNPFVASLIVSLVGLIGLCFAIFFFDRAGRRPLMIWGTLGCSLLSLAIGGLAFKEVNSAVGAGLITLTAMWVFVYSCSFFSIGKHNSVISTKPS